MHDYLEDLYEMCETVNRAISKANEKIRSANGKIDTSDVDYLDKLTHTLASIKKVIHLAESDDEYSERNKYYEITGSYDNGGNHSYARRRNARRDARGRYSRDGRDYSRDDARAEMVDDLREIMNEAKDEHMRQKLQRFISEVENA